MDTNHEAPNPPDPAYWRSLSELAGSQREAARMIKVEDRTMRKWIAGDRVGPWSAAELLRRLILERHP